MHYWYNAHKKIPIHAGVPGFSAIATAIMHDRKTYLNYDRLYTLWQGLSRVSPEDIVVEVGTYRGGSGKFLSRALLHQQSHAKESSRVFLCDTFSGHAVVDPTIDGGHCVNKGFSDVSLDEVKEYLSDCQNISIIDGDIMKTAHRLPDIPIGLLHVDVDVYPPTKFCLNHFRGKIKNAGVVVVDDYGFTTCQGAKKAVDEFMEEHRTEFAGFHLLTGQYLMVKLP